MLIDYETENWCTKNKISIVYLNDPLLDSLQPIYKPPTYLFVKGNKEILSHPSIAIVGARDASQYGIRSALYFGKELAKKGFVIVSGLARGVDAAAHKGALLANGKTIAVLGHGLMHLYPAENNKLAREIIEKGGCLVSEYKPHIPPFKSHFPERNRIIAGLSKGTLVIEAREKSGSLITAKLALDSGKEVFIVPGVFDAPGFHGGHSMVQEGAKLVLSCDDILIELGYELTSTSKDCPPDFPLFRYFQGSCGSLSLEELFIKTSLSLVDLLALLKNGMELGLLVEVFPQNFSWVGGNANSKKMHNEQERYETDLAK